MGSNTEKKKHEPIYKTYTKIEAKRLRATKEWQWNTVHEYL